MPRPFDTEAGGIEPHPREGTDWVSTRDQSHLASASPYLRTFYFISFRNKNNTLFTKDAIFSPASWDVALIDTQY